MGSSDLDLRDRRPAPEHMGGGRGGQYGFTVHFLLSYTSSIHEGVSDNATMGIF